MAASYKFANSDLSELFFYNNVNNVFEAAKDSIATQPVVVDSSGSFISPDGALEDIIASASSYGVAPYGAIGLLFTINYHIGTPEEPLVFSETFDIGSFAAPKSAVPDPPARIGNQELYYNFGTINGWVGDTIVTGWSNYINYTFSNVDGEPGGSYSIANAAVQGTNNVYISENQSTKDTANGRVRMKFQISNTAPAGTYSETLYYRGRGVNSNTTSSDYQDANFTVTYTLKDKPIPYSTDADNVVSTNVYVETGDVGTLYISPKYYLDFDTVITTNDTTNYPVTTWTKTIDSTVLTDFNLPGRKAYEYDNGFDVNNRAWIRFAIPATAVNNQEGTVIHEVAYTGSNSFGTSEAVRFRVHFNYTVAVPTPGVIAPQERTNPTIVLPDRSLNQSYLDSTNRTYEFSNRFSGTPDRYILNDSWSVSDSNISVVGLGINNDTGRVSFKINFSGTTYGTYNATLKLEVRSRNPGGSYQTSGQGAILYIPIQVEVKKQETPTRISSTVDEPLTVETVYNTDDKTVQFSYDFSNSFTGEDSYKLEAIWYYSGKDPEVGYSGSNFDGITSSAPTRYGSVGTFIISLDGDNTIPGDSKYGHFYMRVHARNGDSDPSLPVTWRVPVRFDVILGPTPTLNTSFSSFPYGTEVRTNKALGTHNYGTGDESAVAGPSNWAGRFNSSTPVTDYVVIRSSFSSVKPDSVDYIRYSNSAGENDGGTGLGGVYMEHKYNDNPPSNEQNTQLQFWSYIDVKAKNRYGYSDGTYNNSGGSNTGIARWRMDSSITWNTKTPEAITSPVNRSATRYYDAPPGIPQEPEYEYFTYDVGLTALFEANGVVSSYRIDSSGGTNTNFFMSLYSVEIVNGSTLRFTIAVELIGYVNMNETYFARVRATNAVGESSIADSLVVNLDFTAYAN